MRKELYAEIFAMEQEHWWFAAKHRIVLHLLQEYLPPQSANRQKVADLGCGCGMMLLRLAENYDPIGLDGSRHAIEFAINIAIAHQIGAARGIYSVLSAMDIRNDELFTAFGRSINELILRHRKDLERKRETSTELKIDPRWLEAASSAAGPKGRWVDGTPEYSFYICALRKLFPDALFIHIFRDVCAVVRSMLNFDRVAGTQLVANGKEAYSYWLRTVSACVEAEQAYGPNVIYRIRYADLIDNPESVMRSLLDFLDEPYAAKCLEPLTQRINSSGVPADFKIGDPETDPAVVEQATRLCSEVEKTSQPPEASPAAAVEMETAFETRVQYVATVDSEYQRALRVITTLQKESAQRTAGCSDRQSDSETERGRSHACAAEVKES